MVHGSMASITRWLVVPTPGHTAGHQSVVVQSADGTPDLLIGDVREFFRPLR